MRPVADIIELAGAARSVDVDPAEYARLLGYPRGHRLEGRACELAAWAREWYSAHGRPWFYARQAETFELAGDSILIDGMAFTSKRLQSTLAHAGAHSVILVAIGAGLEAEEESRRRWLDEKPDEYFFLEIFGSAVVEHLTTATGARLCDWAERHGMAVLPHYSPGYPEWDVAEQPRLLDLIKRTRHEQLPSQVDVFDTGMLRPKKTLLAVFGLTRHVERLKPLTSLVPCESCSFGPCEFRRAPYRRAPRPTVEEISSRTSVLDPPVLDIDAQYTVNRKALERWSRERLMLHPHSDGSLDAVFKYDGTTCTNMGRPMTFHYKVTLGPRAEGYPIREQHCAPAVGDTGHEAMCKYIEDSATLMASIDAEKPLRGERLNSVLNWRRGLSAAGCFCEPASREHKWGLVLETIHYALAQQEAARDTENQ
jgi:hypothetical protein